MKMTKILVSLFMLVAMATMVFADESCFGKKASGCASYNSNESVCESYFVEDNYENFQCEYVGESCSLGSTCSMPTDAVPEFGTTAVIVLIAVAAVAGFFVLRKK